MIDRKRKRENKKKIKIVLLIAFLIYISSSFFAMQNRIIKINPRDIEYLEFVKYKEETMRTVNDKQSIKVMTSAIKKIKGKKSTKDASESSEIRVLNLYKKNGGKIEILRKNTFVSIDGIWYKIIGSSSDRFDKLFDEFTK
jgi:hypothetical protein